MSIPIKTQARYAATAAVVAVTALIVGRSLVRQVARAGSEIATTAQQVTAEPESVMDEAVQVRFRLRRTAIASMKSDLRNLVTAEEAYFADSIKYTSSTSCTNPAPAGSAAFCPTTGNSVWPIRLTPHGWLATITNLNVSILCAVAVGPGAHLGDAPSGQPVCVGEHWPYTRAACVASGRQWEADYAFCRP